VAFYPYLSFGGNCREAFTRYHEIFGGDITVLGMGDMPPEEASQMPPGSEDLVMHAALALNGDWLMGSDDPTGSFEGMRGIHVNYSVPEVAEAERVWAALSDGGEVTMPLAETFWAPRFGMCVDRFGTPWMINAEPAQEGPAT
jgi:PhnB protein